MEGGRRVEGRQALYLYCLVAGPPLAVPGPGVEGAGAPFAVRFREVCGLVARVLRDAYSAPALERKVADAGWIAAMASRHDAVIRRVMADRPVVPVRFGTLFLSRERLLETLGTVYEPLCACLARLAEKEEWGLKVWAPAEPAARGADAPAADDAGSGSPGACHSGAAYLTAKLRERRRREAEWRSRNERAAAIFREAAAGAAMARRLPIRPASRTENLVLNAAFLVGRREVGAFHATLDELAHNHAAHGWVLRRTGPWPPYSFADVRLGAGGGAASPGEAESWLAS